MSMEFSIRPDRTGFGIRAILIAVFLMATQDALIKQLSAGPSLWQIWTLRGLVTVPLLAVAAAGSSGDFRWAEVFDRWVFTRAALLAAMYVALYAVLPVLPLASIAAGYYTGPLFITLLSAVLVGERVGPRGWAAVGAGFAGTLVLLRPGTTGFQGALLAPVLSGFFYALAAVITRARCRGRSILALALSLNVVLLLAGIVASVLFAALPRLPGVAGPGAFLTGGWAPLDLPDLGVIMLLAVLMLGIGIGLAAAYQAASPVIIAPFDFSYLIFATVFGIVLFSDVPDVGTLLGMAMIAGGGLLSLRAS